MADLKISVDMRDIPAAVQATQRFERQINTLAGQLARGSITTGTYQKALQQLSQRYAKLGVDVNRAKSAVMSYGRAAAESAREQQALLAATQESTKGFARSGVVMQQTGYQVGDFLVQVQSGTNAFVAFGQQATQLAGLLTMSMNPSLIALGAGLSIAIPLMTAIAAAFMRTSDAGKSFADRLSEADRAVESLKEATNLLRTDSLSQLEDTYGRVNDSLREFLVLSAEALRLNAIENVVGSLNSLKYELRGFFATETTSLQSLFNINVGQANQLVSSLTRAVEATNLDAQLQNVIELRDRILAVTGNVENMTSAQRQFYLQVIEAEGGLRRALNAANSVADAIAQGATNAATMAARLREIPGRGAPMSAQPMRLSAMGAFATAPGAGTATPESGAGAARDGIGGLAQSLLTGMEKLEMFRTDALSQLENFNSMELDILGGHNEARIRIEEEYQNRLSALRAEGRQQTLSETAGLFGALANIAQAGGAKTVKAVATFQAIEGTINAYGAAIKALNTPGLGLAGRFAAYASVLGAGLKGVAAIRQAGGVGGGGGGAATVEPIPASVSAAPQRVVIEGIDRDTLISGEQLSRLFDRLYEENNERGLVFSVAR
jgi:hypothetical protein